jgi:hypothetical protein
VFDLRSNGLLRYQGYIVLAIIEDLRATMVNITSALPKKHAVFNIQDALCERIAKMLIVDMSRWR